MAVLIGIDEAGYGPILGPLVVSAAAFHLDDKLLTVPLWDVLRHSVCKHRRGSAGRIIINDSKKLHNRRGDYNLLQRGVLACLVAANSATGVSVASADGADSVTADGADSVASDGVNAPPGSFTELLGRLEVAPIEQLDRYPWYGKRAMSRPLAFDRDDIATAGAALARDLQQHNMRLLSLWSQPLLAGEFNRMVQAVNNKATVLFTLAGGFIHRAYRQYGGAGLQIVIDKHGGRSHYRAHLQRMFPHLQMKILKEDEAISSYCLSESNRTMRIHFLARGDARQLPIALASMASKYVRELFMESLNDYFGRHCPDIAPTAGYYQDGQRFLADMQACRLDASQAPRSLLVRER